MSQGIRPDALPSSTFQQKQEQLVWDALQFFIPCLATAIAPFYRRQISDAPTDQY
ncbi:MAG TPA: hypothetical protein V6D48_02680 [Oculatellaceae cyanobacterium]